MYEVGEMVDVRDDDGLFCKGTILDVSTYEREALVECDDGTEKWISFEELDDIRDAMTETASWF